MPDGELTNLECPRDGGVMLVAVDRNGVMIDACPSCRGIWLDRGELEKLIDLEAAASEDFLAEIRGSSRDSERKSERHGSAGGSKKRRRGGLLGEMFDFG